MVGHADVLRNFTNAWDARNIHPMHPVWMLTGPRGIGKATLAYKIAKIVYDNIGDFFIVDLAHNIDKDGTPKTNASQISVYTVRAMIERMHMSSMSDEWRVVLIDAVDEMNAAAENAMLKLLEEPPAKTLFLLVVHSLARVLPTVRSRARIEKMRPLSINELRTLCSKFIPESEISNETLKLSNGSFGRIASLKTVGGDKIYDLMMETLQNPRASSDDMMNIARRIAPFPELYGILLDAIASLGLADLYPNTTRAITEISNLHLDGEIGIFKILKDIKKCL